MKPAGTGWEGMPRGQHAASIGTEINGLLNQIFFFSPSKRHR